MDTHSLLHNPISMAKRPCPSQTPILQSQTPIQPPPPPPPPPTPPLNQVDQLLESFLALSDPSLSIDLSFDRLLDSRASSDSDQAQLIDRAVVLGSALLNAAKRSSRKRASSHNSLSWPLPPDLTIKVPSLSSLSLSSISSQFRC